MAKGRKPLKDLKQKNGRGEKIVRKRRPSGFTLSEKCVTNLDFLYEELEMNKSRIVEFLINREAHLVRSGMNSMKTYLMLD